MENYHGDIGRHRTAAVWMEPEMTQLSFMSGCSSLFSISSLREEDELLPGAWSLPATPVSLMFAGGDKVDMQLQRDGRSGGDDRRIIRNMRNRESALGSRARKKAYVEELEKQVRCLVDDNLKLKKQYKELKQEVGALILPNKSSLRRTSSAKF